jgi:hypothetical protein
MCACTRILAHRKCRVDIWKHNTCTNVESRCQACARTHTYTRHGLPSVRAQAHSYSLRETATHAHHYMHTHTHTHTDTRTHTHTHTHTNMHIHGRSKFYAFSAHTGIHEYKSSRTLSSTKKQGKRKKRPLSLQNDQNLFFILDKFLRNKYRQVPMFATRPTITHTRLARHLLAPRYRQKPA